MSRESNDKEAYIKLYDYLPQKGVDMAVVLTLILMAFYYIWRVAYITPWYDELYTYYYFISRGPLYAAIHWPLPNNHVGYSVISAVFDLFGNSYVGLRGVSFICAIVNNYLVYRICRRFMNEWLSYGAMLLYFSNLLVNDLSVQGRGYTFATTCFLVCIREIIIICSGRDEKVSDYVILAAGLTIGLYTLPSSIYWVIPTCVAALIFLLINGKRSLDENERLRDNYYFIKLHHFILAGVIAAAVTVILYAVIWLSIGSNLIVKDETSQFFGMGHVSLILHHPIKAASEGIRYMLAQPYIQSVPRSGYLGSLWGWIKALTGYMYPVHFAVTIVFVIAGFVILLSGCIRHFENSRTIFSLILMVNAVGFLIMLMLQAKLPYYRVFSYMGFVCAVCDVIVVELIYNAVSGLIISKVAALSENDLHNLIPTAFIALFALLMFTDPAYFAQHGDREASCYNALFVMNPTKDKKLCVMDCDQQYLLKFGWDIDCENTDPTDCDYVLVDRNMLEEGYGGPDAWKFYRDYDTMPWDYINSEMYLFYENEDFLLYKK